MSAGPARRAGPGDAGVLAEMLHAFNREFATPTPDVAVLTGRLTRLLAGDDLIALLAGDPPEGFAILALRPNACSVGPVALLDELYVAPARRGRGTGGVLLEAAVELARARDVGWFEIGVDGDDVAARRFYAAHGFTEYEPGATEPTYLYHREL